MRKKRKMKLIVLKSIVSYGILIKSHIMQKKDADVTIR